MPTPITRQPVDFDHKSDKFLTPVPRSTRISGFDTDFDDIFMPVTTTDKENVSCDGRPEVLKDADLTKPLVSAGKPSLHLAPAKGPRSCKSGLHLRVTRPTAHQTIEQELMHLTKDDLISCVEK